MVIDIGRWSIYGWLERFYCISVDVYTTCIPYIYHLHHIIPYTYNIYYIYIEEDIVEDNNGILLGID